MEPYAFFLPGSFDLVRLNQLMARDSDLKCILFRHKEIRAALLDTFPGELFHSGRMLLQCDEQLSLFNFQSCQFVSQPLAPEQEEWRFVDEISGPVGSGLKGVSKLRRLLEVGELKVQPGLLTVEDEERKTRVRVHFVEIFAAENVVIIGIAEPLRGYDEDWEHLVKILGALGAQQCRDCRYIYQILGIAIPEYTAKPEVVLAAEAPAKESARRIIESLLNVARANEAGIVSDDDTEYLHDYRVALRKVRSVLSLLKGVYSERETERLKLLVGTIMKETNRLRDLDVFLLNDTEYHSLVSSMVQSGLSRLFATVGEQRREAQRVVAATLTRKGYLQKMDRLVATFGPERRLAAGPAAKLRTFDYACQLILRRYKKVCKAARRIDHDTASAEVHQLRIQCKKLRYLMEFFSPLFPAEEIKLLIKALKGLQDRLGTFNDYCVQQQFIRCLLPTGQELSTENMEVIESIGALGGVLHMRQIEEREKIMESFQQFDSPEVQASFFNLFYLEDPWNENNRLLQQ